jgi:hypothetical protein
MTWLLACILLPLSLLMDRPTATPAHSSSLSPSSLMTLLESIFVGKHAYWAPIDATYWMPVTYTPTASIYRTLLKTSQWTSYHQQVLLQCHLH